MISWIWPSHFCKDCPPERADSADGIFYRIVKSDPPTQTDYISMYCQNRKRAEEQVTQGRRSLCEIMGLSVYADEADAIGCANQFPQIGNKIASVTLNRSAGKTQKTSGNSESHHTWWKAVEFNPVKQSQVIRSL